LPPDEELTKLPPMKTSSEYYLDIERTVQFDFVRATENAALNVVHWLGRGQKELADAAACDAIRGMFDLMDICGEVVIGEGIKDNAPGIFKGEQLGTWLPGTTKFDIALDPIDGTSNLANGLPNSISVIAASHVSSGEKNAMRNLPSFYSRKSGFSSPLRLDDINEIANMLHAKWQLGMNGAVLIANPLPTDQEIVAEEMEIHIQKALNAAKKRKITGKEVTPFLLQYISEHTKGESLEANIALIKNNARLGAELAVAYTINHN